MFFLYLYGASENKKSLNKQRYKLFTKYATKNKINLAPFPSTEEANRQQSLLASAVMAKSYKKPRRLGVEVSK